MSERPHSEAYREPDGTYQEPDPAVEGGTPAEDPDDRTNTGFAPFAWPWSLSGSERARETDDRYPGDYDAERDDDGWLDEGLITLTIVAGLVLLFFPEPATSALGLVLITVGLLAWVVDWAT